jgi:hypothetical protein
MDRFNEIILHIWAYLGLLFDKNVLQNIWANILVILATVALVMFFRHRRMLRFFGFKRNKHLTIWFTRASHAHTHEEGNCTCPAASYSGADIAKYEELTISFFSTLFSRLTSEAKIIESEFHKLQLTKVEISYRNSPEVFEELSSFHNFICIGGPLANSVTARYLEQVPTHMGFSAPNFAVVVKAGKRKGATFVSEGDYEYGYIEKLIDPDHKTAVFIVAGYSIVATTVAAYYLTENWRLLQKRYGSKPFAVCLKVAESSLSWNWYMTPEVVYQSEV